MTKGSSGVGTTSTDTPPTPRLDWRRRFPFYYGWLIAVACAITLGLTYTVWYSFSVFYVALLEQFGWSRASSAGVFSVFVFFVGIAGVASGALADRHGPGKVGAVGAGILVVGLVACSRITELWQFYFFYGVICAAGVGTAGWIPAVTMVSRWFSAKYGQAIGIASAGIGLGIVVVIPATQVIISAAGWRTAFIALAGVVLFGTLPIEAFLLRGRAEDIGLLRDGRLPTAQPDTNTTEVAPQPSRVVDAEWAKQTWTVSTAVRTTRFWFVFAMLATGNVASQMIMVHQVAFLVDGGYDKLMAASIAGLVGLISIFAKAGWGWVSDVLGRELTWTLGFGSMMAGICFLAATRLVPFPMVIYLYSLAFAVGYAVAPPLSPAAASDIFAGRRFGSIYGALGMGNSLGSAAGALIAGYVFDVTGSYFLAFGIALIGCVLAVAFMWIAAPSRVRIVPGQLRRRLAVGR